MQVNEILHQVPFFKALSESDIEQVVSKLTFKTYDTGQAICRIDEPGDKMFIIISGKVRICILDNFGEEQEVAQLDAGNYFGEMALLTGEPRTATVYTAEPAEMFILGKGEFENIIDMFPLIQLELNKIMSQRLRQNLAKAMEMTKKAAKKEIVQKTAAGKLSPEKSIVEIMAFCDQKGLTGDVEIDSNGNKGHLSFDSGQILSMSAGTLKDDEALDEMLGWDEGTFVIKPREVSFDELLGADAVEAPADSGAAEAAKPAEDDSILVVSNSLVVRKLLERKLQSMNKTVKAAKNLASAKNSVEAIIPKCIVADLKFDDGTAKELAEYFRGKTENHIVVITDGKVPSDLQLYANGQANIHLTASHDIAEVTDHINRIG